MKDGNVSVATAYDAAPEAPASRLAPTPGSRDHVASVMERVFEECRALRGAGQKEYAHNDARAFANFEKLADDLELSREKILLIYAKKHWDGIVAYVKGHRSQREPVSGRINDMIVYMILLRSMFEEEALRGQR